MSNIPEGTWIVFGNFKLKEWEISGGEGAVAGTFFLVHKPCRLGSWSDELTMPEILDIIAEHKCPIVS